MTCCCFFTGIPAIVLSLNELKAIDRGEASPSGRALAIIGLVTGILGTLCITIGNIGAYNNDHLRSQMRGYGFPF